MKNFSVFIIGLSLLLFCTTGFCIGTNDDLTAGSSNASAANSINVTSSPDLNGLATNWAFEFGQLNPTVKINLANAGENQQTVHLNFISNESSQVENAEQGWKMVVGRDAIVAVFNAKNPMLEAISQQGLSSEEFALLFSNSEMRNWKNLIVGGQNTAVNYHVIDNGKVNSTIANFTGIDNFALNGKIAATGPEFLAAIEKDVYAIGFCKLTDVRDANTNEIMAGVKLLPIDKNANGRIDNFENIYSNMATFTRGVWIGKYLNALSGNIYATAPAKPTDKSTLAFLSWVTSDGQKCLKQNGFSDLASRDVTSNLVALAGTEMVVVPKSSKSIFSSVWFVVLLVFGTVVLIITAFFLYVKKQKFAENAGGFEITPLLNEEMIMAPKGLYFGKTHTWAFMEKDGNVKMGVDDFIQHVTGSLTRIQMREPGDKVRKGERILTVMRDGKQLNIYSPISGTIKAHNTSLLSDSSLINTSPFAEGWVYLIEPLNWVREIQFLFMGEKYKEWLGDEFSRLKDFFAESVRTNTTVYQHIILQDGGELKDNALADLGPEVWEDFQTKFIDTSK